MLWKTCASLALLILVGCSSSNDTEIPAPTANPPSDRAVTSSDAVSPDDSKSTPEVRKVEVPSADGVAIRYEVHGEKKSDRPTLVFVHGWCCNRTFWLPQLSHFAKEYQVVAVDLAGHGESAGGRETWTMEAFGRDVAAVVNDVGAERVVLIGHSMGGPVILEAAAILSEKVVGLIPVDAFTDPNEEYSEGQMAEFRKPFEDDFPTAMHDALHHEHDFFSDATSDALKERITMTMTSAPPNMGIGAFQGMLDFANERQRPLMKQTKGLFVCINAKRNEEKVADGKQHAPQFDVITLPAAGHFLMMEHPQAFNALLGKTLSQIKSEPDAASL
ncbi:MAG: alpha/beta hydrolase [Planctomycetota bacterium]|nr:alpha/beta hydrolase [Planctomycetota bacterium]